MIPYFLEALAYAWEDIGSGDPDRIQAGNADLLLREQERVIQDDYDAMREHHGPVGDVFTYGFSTMAENPMPGGQAYRDYDPIELTVDLVPDVPVGPLGPFGPQIDIPTPDAEQIAPDLAQRLGQIYADVEYAYRG